MAGALRGVATEALLASPLSCTLRARPQGSKHSPSLRGVGGADRGRVQTLRDCAWSALRTVAREPTREFAVEMMPSRP